MKKIVCLLLIALMLFLPACQNDPPGQGAPDIPDQEADGTGGSAGRVNTTFRATEVFRYGGGANVPEYTVLPGLDNIVNKNQYFSGTDEVGDYYFALQLSDEASGLIERNGFAVIDPTGNRGNYREYREFYSLYESNRYSYVPSFITADSAVHSFHLMYNYLLKDVERGSLAAHLETLTNQMAEASYQQYLELKGTAFENAALRNAAFFGVGGRLLNDDFALEKEVAALVRQELALIERQAGVGQSPLINYGQSFEDSSEYYNVDYSQFIPRGHYTQSAELERYFKASMWYGQMTLRSAYPDEVRSALLMTSALQDAENKEEWSAVFDAVNFFVGECDDITPLDYREGLSEIYGDGLGSLDAVTDERRFEQALEVIGQMPAPAVNSIPVYDEDIQPDIEKAVTGFRFLGQRFTIDAAIFQRLMDRETKDRSLPNALDIPAAFGSDEAYNILKSDFGVGGYPDYDANLADAREYLSAVEDGVWTSNLYWSWLNMLRPLTGNAGREGYPFFMRNAAWTRKELNTFLGSWTELKHDTMLYTKQPDGGMGAAGPEPPPPPDDRGYVEPNPELFGRLALLVKQTREGLGSASLMTADADAGLERLYTVATALTEISVKELANTPLTDEEYDFIRAYGNELELIWDAAKKDELEALEAEHGFADKILYLQENPDALITDVATDPDGTVLEEATGFAKPIVVAFPRDGGVALGLGLVYSHYEFTVPLDGRMTDGDWHQALNRGEIPPLAAWKTAYTAVQ